MTAVRQRTTNCREIAKSCLAYLPERIEIWKVPVIFQDWTIIPMSIIFIDT